MKDERRANTRLQEAVEHGIALARAEGSAVAWVYMRACAVPEGAVKRVLAYPSARRTSVPADS